MALTINTNIKNDADGYLLDASSVKVEEGLMLNEALEGKQTALTFDATPTAGSSNPVTSGGIKTALNETVAAIKSANDLVNYYTKSQTYTQTEINQKISAIPKFAIKVVQSLPVSDISDTTVYLVPNGSGGTQNLYDEYIHTTNGWEKLGSQTVDLTGYATETWVINQLGSKQNTLTFDTTPTAGSTNPVTSGGIKSALDTKNQSVPITLTAAGWSNKIQTANVPGILADESKQLILPVPTSTSRGAYEAAGIEAITQNNATLTFVCDTVPTADISIYVIITDVLEVS